ncbi:MAG TPA: DEAD/DEAH box helicase [Streptosporangiaceae bacterium]|nr:DEAD/DEAH box helicase [Streptosporangiaceae bacterium]
MEAKALTTQDLTSDLTEDLADLTDPAMVSIDALTLTVPADPADLPDELVTTDPATAGGPAFDEFGVAEPICAALAAAGITRAFPIQALTLPIALDQHDVIGQARTGTGKTLAFAIPIMQHLIGTPRAKAATPRALVVVPTRELAIQVAGDLRTAAALSEVNVVTLYGGRAYEPQIEALATVDVVVGTPGRLLDLARQRKLDLSGIDTLVLDEADRMLDLGFLPDVEAILRLTPAHRQTMLFSATMPSEIVTLARRHLHRPTHIRAEQHDEPAHVPTTHQHVFRAHHLDKIEVLARVLQAEGRGLTIVFCRTRRSCDHVTAELAGRGFAAAAVHGDLGQSQRERALRAFRHGKIDVLVATDVAARGLDVEDVTHVVNNECPEDEKAYLHRIGRTGRAGRAGVAVTFVDWQDMARWKLINDALSLGHPEPLETYSTSSHLFSALGIPAGATGSLPVARRGRAGLDAEDLEDIGETGKNRSRAHASSRRPRDERGSGHRPGDGAQGGHRAGGGRTRTRSRTRGGAPVGTPAADHAAADQPALDHTALNHKGTERTAAAEDQVGPARQGQSASGAQRSRRRSRGGRGRVKGASQHAADGQPRSASPASPAEQRDIEEG